VYQVAGFAGFKITGYYFSSYSRASATGGNLCSGNQRCLYGYFVQATVPILKSGGPDYGLSGTGAVKIIG
jgi:hypothetical protein